MDENNIILQMEHISKQFPGVLANDDINLCLKKGEIIALLGENGAGKSTLMNILYGLIKPTCGTILINGQKAVLHSPKDGINLGLGMVHQHFMLVGNLTVTENIVLGQEPGKFGLFDYKTAREQVITLSRRYNLEIEPDIRIENLPVGMQQRVEILKALYRKAQILILDEPTAVLTPPEVKSLFAIMRNLKANGVSMIIITHKLEEVLAISGRVYILRKGKVAGEKQTAQVTSEELANLMVGRSIVLSRVHRQQHTLTGQTVLQIRNLSVLSDRKLPAVRNLSLTVRPGEIVAIAGVDGNGQGELAEAVAGIRKSAGGTIFFKGQNITGKSAGELRRLRFSYVPADRQKQGLILSMTLAENVLLGTPGTDPVSAKLFLNHAAIEKQAVELVMRYNIQAASVKLPVSSLSGGNQQKVILAREFSRQPEFLLVSQPTRGLDVGAIEYVHARIREMQEAHTAILLISMELEEIFRLADRILVLYKGEIIKELATGETDESEVGCYMAGSGSREAQCDENG